MELIDIIENKFWQKCIETKCGKNQGFDYMDRSFFANEFEIKLFTEHLLQILIEKGYICKPKISDSNKNQSLNFHGIKRRIIVVGRSSSVYFFTEAGLVKLHEKYAQQLIMDNRLNNPPATQ